MSNCPTVLAISSFDEAISKIKAIKTEYLNDGVVVLRGHTFSEDEQFNLVQRLGDLFGWSIDSNTQRETVPGSIYTGGHSADKTSSYGAASTDYVLDWHIEQVYYISPIVAGIWNMTTFTAPRGHGNTLFVDAATLYNDLSEVEKDLLSNATVVWSKPSPTTDGPYYTKAVGLHPVLGVPILRVETDRGCYSSPELYKVSGSPPSDSQIELFTRIMNKVKYRLTVDTDIRLTQEWEQGDLLVVDLYRMYHAVLGGFKYGERTFTGESVTPKGSTQGLYISEDLVA